MVQTLRITSVVVGLLAVALIALSVVHGIEPDAEVAKILGSTSALAQFESKQGKSDNTPQAQAKSPLVLEAEKYAQIVNPRPESPRPPIARSPGIRRPPPGPAVRPPMSTAKFRLEATCLNAADPNASLAFIDEPGKGQYWVRKGDRIGHQTLLEILDGVVKLSDGQTIEELHVQREPKVSLYAGGNKKNRPRPAARRAPPRPTQRHDAISVRATSPSLTSPSTSPVSRPIETREDAQELERIANALKNFKPPVDANKSPEALEAERQIRETAMKRLMKLSQSYREKNSAAKDQ